MSATNTSEAINNIKAPYTNKEGSVFSRDWKPFLISFVSMVFFFGFYFLKFESIKHLIKIDHE